MHLFYAQSNMKWTALLLYFNKFEMCVAKMLIIQYKDFFPRLSTNAKTKQWKSTKNCLHKNIFMELEHYTRSPKNKRTCQVPL